MSRYDVKIVMRSEYSMVVEAPDPFAAQSMAMGQLGDQSAQQTTFEVKVEEGVK